MFIYLIVCTNEQRFAKNHAYEMLISVTQIQCSYARLPFDDNHKMKGAYSEFLKLSPYHFPLPVIHFMSCPRDKLEM